MGEIGGWDNLQFLNLNLKNPKSWTFVTKSWNISVPFVQLLMSKIITNFFVYLCTFLFTFKDIVVVSNYQEKCSWTNYCAVSANLASGWSYQTDRSSCQPKTVVRNNRSCGPYKPKLRSILFKTVVLYIRRFKLSGIL